MLRHLAELLTPAQAAHLLGVSTRTLAEWERKGLLAPVRTAGGHRRYLAEQVLRLGRRSGTA